MHLTDVSLDFSEHPADLCRVHTAAGGKACLPAPLKGNVARASSVTGPKQGAFHERSTSPRCVKPPPTAPPPVVFVMQTGYNKLITTPRAEDANCCGPVDPLGREQSHLS